MQLKNRNMSNILSSGLAVVAVACMMLLVLQSCNVYSFKQGSIPAEVQTISIANIYNESGGGPPNLGQIFTEKLKSYYQQNSRLKLVNSNGDWQLEGRILTYQSTGVAPQGDKARLNRLTITLQAKFISLTDEKANFEQAFSFFTDYPQEQTLTLVEADLIQLISDQIVIDIFNKTTSNW